MLGHLKAHSTAHLQYTQSSLASRSIEQARRYIDVLEDWFYVKGHIVAMLDDEFIPPRPLSDFDASLGSESSLKAQRSRNLFGSLW